MNTANNSLLRNKKTPTTTLNHHLAAAVAASQTFNFLDYTIRPVICHLTIARRRQIDLHTHRFCELSFVTGDPMNYYTADTDITVENGQVFLMPPGIQHGWDHRGKSDVFGFMLEVGHKKATDGRLLEQAAAAMNYHWTPNEETLNRFRSFIQDAVLTDEFIPASCSALAQALVTSVLKEAFQQLPKKRVSQAEFPVTRDLLLDEAENYIKVHLSHSPRAPEVAQHLGISVRQLTRMFQAKYGVPLGEWSLNERLALAQSLLANERSMPVKVVAAECGFSNVSNFCLRFCRSFHSTPARYRALCQQDIGKQPAQKNPKQKTTR